MFLRIQDPAVLRRTLKLMKIMGTRCRMFMMRKTGEAKFLVTDAKSPHLDIEAVVKLTPRVPTGSHGLFVREVELRKLYNCKHPIT
ncbi:hypothetical protein AB3S75_029664 [Citrus x aurantiifolia]